MSSLFPRSMPYARRISTRSGVCPADEPGRRGGTRQSDESSFQPNERCAARTTATFGGVSVSSSSSDVASSSELSDTSSTTARRRRLPRVLGKPHLSARLIPSFWRTTVTSGGKGRLGPSRLARFGTRTSSGMGSQSITRVDSVSRRRTSLQPSTPRAVRCARSRETLGKTRVAGWAPCCGSAKFSKRSAPLWSCHETGGRMSAFGSATGALGRPSVCVALRGFHDADAQGDRRYQVSHRARRTSPPSYPDTAPGPSCSRRDQKDCPHPTKTAENGSPPDPHRPHPQSQSGLRR